MGVEGPRARRRNWPPWAAPDSRSALLASGLERGVFVARVERDRRAGISHLHAEGALCPPFTPVDAESVRRCATGARPGHATARIFSTRRFRQENASRATRLNFNKGCYIGQEIVERIRLPRATSNRMFGGPAASTPPRRPARRKPNSRSAAPRFGEITSAAFLAGVGKSSRVGLRARAQFATPGPPVSRADGAAGDHDTRGLDLAESRSSTDRGDV